MFTHTRRTRSFTIIIDVSPYSMSHDQSVVFVYYDEAKLNAASPPPSSPPAPTPRPRLTSADSPQPAGRCLFPVGPQLSRAPVARLMRRCSHNIVIIWIYITSAPSSTFTSVICGFAKSPTSINGLYCKSHPVWDRFVSSAMESLVWLYG